MRDAMRSEYDPRDAQSAPQWPVAPAQTPPATAPLPAHLAPSLPASAGRRPVRRRSFVGDVSAGLFFGDFARDLGLPGAITQVAVSFVPLLGSICAVRDLTADLRRHDHIGAALNALALTPIVGGFSKTFEVIRSTAHVGHAVHISHQQAQRKHDGGEVAQPIAQPVAQQRRHR
jgi:hypothetical protein